MTFALRALAASVLAATALTAQAGVITIGGQAVTNADRTENFQSLAPGSNVTAVADSGLSISPGSTQGLSIVNSPNCRNTDRGMSGKYAALGMSHQCLSQPALPNSVFFTFDEAVSELSWTGFSLAAFNGFKVQALRGGVVVSETAFTLDNRFSKQTVLFSGSVFDEIVVMENGAWGGYIGIDNMAWKLAPAEVPLPGTLALMGIGMLGMGYKRKKKAA